MGDLTSAEPDRAARLTGKHLRAVLTNVCAQAGLDPVGASLIKFTNNAVFALADAPVVVRIAGSQTMRDRVDKVISVARWLAAHDMPAVRLWPGPQPVLVDGHLATLWHAAPTTGPAPTGADLGRILRQLHSLPGPKAALPVWRPLHPIRQRLTEAELASDAELAFLGAQCDEVEEALAQLAYPLPRGPIHGDSSRGNLVPTHIGPVICDFDSTSFGPREWDLTPVAVGKFRFKDPGDHHDQLAEAYGFDVTRWEGFGVLRQLRELQLVTSVLPVLRSNPTLVEQWRHRIATVRAEDQTALWTPYR